jgi:hypothetical protein
LPRPIPLVAPVIRTRRALAGWMVGMRKTLCSGAV